MLQLLVLTVLLALTTGAARAATPVGSFALDQPPGVESYTPFGGPALTADGVGWAQRTASGWSIWRWSAATSARLQRPVPGADSVLVDGAGTVLAAREYSGSTDKYGYENFRYDRIVSVGADGTATDLTCGGKPCVQRPLPAGYAFDADGDTIAWLGFTGTDLVAVVHDVLTGAQHRLVIPRPVGIPLGVPFAYGLRVSGDKLAYERWEGGRAIVVVDLATGAGVQSVPVTGDYDLDVPGAWDIDDEGRVLTSGRRLAWFAPGDPNPHVVGGPVLSRPRIDGGRILFARESDGAIVLSDLAGARRVIRASAPGRRRIVGEVELDGRRAAWAERRCRTTTIVTTQDVDAEQPESLPPRTTCGRPQIHTVRVTSTGVAVRLTCTLGCAGDLAVGGADKRRFRLGASRRQQTVVLRPSRRAVRRLAARRGQRTSVTITLRQGSFVVQLEPVARRLR